MAKVTHKKSANLKNSTTKEKVGSGDIYRYIDWEQQLYRVSQNIGLFRYAVTRAEHIQFPQRYDLYRTYQDSLLDSHLSGLIHNYKNLVLSREFNFYKADGTIDEQLSELLKTKWFMDFCDLALDSKFWGHSLIQLGDLTDDGFSAVELIPRWYVKPEFHVVTKNYTDIVGQDYLDPQFTKWVVPVGNPKDLGLLLQASFHCIWKKTALGAWAEYTLIFGVPTIVFSTNTKDPETMKAADQMLKKWRSSQKIVKNQADKIEFQDPKSSDASKVFLDLATFCNDEMSKLIIGGTGNMDDKSHVGAAKTHENNQQRVKHAVTFFLEDVINRQLKPVLAEHGFPVNDLKCKITDNTDVEDEIKKDIDLALIASQKYKLSPEYIKETYGSEVEEIEVQQEPIVKGKSIKNALDDYYK